MMMVVVVVVVVMPDFSSLVNQWEYCSFAVLSS
jgi:hypothetical protein